MIEATPGGERIVHCLQCGSCGGSCPSGADMEYTPRTLFAMINAGDRDDGAGGQHDVGCVSCYFCTTRCPQDIPITDIMYALKRMSIAERRYKDTDAPALAKTFTDFVDKYGRSFEFGLATGYLPVQQAAGDDEDGPDGLVDVHPRPHGADAHQDPPDRPASGHYQKARASGKIGR